MATVPSVHLNGTAGDALKAQTLAVIQQLNLSLAALAEATPNGRDYYVQDNKGHEGNALKIAMNLHHARLNKITQVRDEYVTIYEEICDQIDQRRSRGQGTSSE